MTVPTLEEMRRWMGGENIEGLPSRLGVWDEKPAKLGSPRDTARVTLPYVPRATSSAPGTKGKGLSSAMAAAASKAARPRASGPRVRMTTDGSDAELLFGKHKGSTIVELARQSFDTRSYLYWLKDKAHIEEPFPEDFIELVKETLRSETITKKVAKKVTKKVTE